LTEHFSDLRKEKTFRWRWSLIEEGFQSASAIAAVSTSLKRTITDLDLASPSEVDVQPNLVSPSLFFRPLSNRSLSSPFHFVTVTHLRSPKNVDGLLNAFAQLAETDSAVTMSIVGDGPDRDRLERQAQRLGIDDHVRFRGRLDRDSVRTALWNAHAFVLASHRETFGIVLIEAMATGLPVVSTACGGPEDILTPETGILVPARDVRALAGGLRRMKDRWSSFDPASIRQHTLDRYGPELFVRRTRLLYRRALEQAQ
jgi:glycosyltransferase involved in cell wall biosynthesis